MKEVQDEPVDIYISSSWFDNGHWMWDIADTALDNMLNEKGGCLFAFDESGRIFNATACGDET